MTASPAELQAIRDATAMPAIDSGTDRRKLLALYDAQSDDVRRLREALERLTELYALPGESNVDRFERVAEMFYRETGCYAPGKDVAAAAGDSVSMVERVARWEAWYVARAEKGRAALGSQP